MDEDWGESAPIAQIQYKHEIYKIILTKSSQIITLFMLGIFVIILINTIGIENKDLLLSILTAVIPPFSFVLGRESVDKK